MALIKWNRSNAQKLSKAVASFNKKISSTLQDDTFFPEKRSYIDLKNNIFTESELNRVVNSLKQFQKKSASQIVAVGNTYITKWELNELKKAKTVQLQRLKNEYKKYEKKNKQGISRVQMGHKRPKEIEEKIAKLKNMSNEELVRESESILAQGRLDYKTRQAVIWRDNFIEQMKEFEKVKGYRNLKNEMNRLYSDPKKFYKKFGKNEIFGDLHLYSDNVITDEQLESWLHDLKII